MRAFAYLTLVVSEDLERSYVHAYDELARLAASLPAGKCLAVEGVLREGLSLISMQTRSNSSMP
jgi:hypothetical protein